MLHGFHLRRELRQARRPRDAASQALQVDVERVQPRVEGHGLERAHVEPLQVHVPGPIQLNGGHLEILERHVADVQAGVGVAVDVRVAAQPQRPVLNHAVRGGRDALWLIEAPRPLIADERRVGELDGVEEAHARVVQQGLGERVAAQVEHHTRTLDGDCGKEPHGVSGVRILRIFRIWRYSLW